MNKIKNLVQISTIVTESTDFYEIKDKIVDKMLEVVHPKKACVNLFHCSDLSEAYLVCSETLQYIPKQFTSDKTKFGYKIDFDNYPDYIKDSVRTRRIIYIPDVFSDPKAIKERVIARFEGYVGRIVFPMVISGNVVGFLTCFLKDGEYVDEDDIDYIKQVVTLMSLSIEITKKNGVTREIISKLRKTLGTVSEAIIKLYENKDMQNFLDLSCENVCRLTDSLQSCIVVYEKNDEGQYEEKYINMYDEIGNTVDFHAILDEIYQKDDKHGFQNYGEKYDRVTKHDGVNSYIFSKASRNDVSIAMVCVNAHSYSTDDDRILDIFKNQLFLALYQFETLEENIKHEVLKKELSMIREQQKLIMNRSNAVLQGDRELFYYHEPSSIVGGDVYLAETQNRNVIKFMVADVMGHGIVANYIVALMKGAFKVLCKQTSSPGKILRSMNSNLYEEFDKMGVFATCIIGTLNMEKNSLIIANAGHYFPIIVKNANTIIDFSRGNRGIPIGVLENTNYENNLLHVSDYQMITFFTDGILETVNLEGEEYGPHRFEKFLLKNYTNPPREFIKNFKKEMQKFSGKEKNDDILLVSIKKRT